MGKYKKEKEQLDSSTAGTELVIIVVANQIGISPVVLYYKRNFQTAPA